MSVKLLPLASSKKFHHRVNLFVFFSSIPCPVDVEALQETPQNSPNVSDYESVIKSLRNKLVPDSLIRVLGSTGDIESSVRIFKWAALQPRFQNTAGTYGAIILKVGLSGDVKEMEGFCHSMIREKCPGAEDALISLIEKFVELGRASAAIRVLVSMIAGGFRPKTELFNVILGALVVEKGDLKDIIFVYKEMVKAGRLPTIDTLNFLMEALLEAGWVDSALDQYRRVSKKGCRPNSRTFDVLIKNLIMKGRINDAVLILQEMLELGMEMDLEFYTSVIPLFCRENKLAEGIRLFETMKASELVPDLSVYRTLIHQLCSQLLLDEAHRLLEEMIDNGVIPWEDVFEDMVIGLCKLGKITEGMKLLEDKQVLATSPYNLLLSSCCDAGELFTAKELLEKMYEGDIAGVESWNILIRWLCEQSKFKQALQVLSRMIVASFVPNSSTDSALILGHCKLGELNDAMELFDRLRSRCWVLDSLSYSELIKGLCATGRTLEASEVFRYMSKKKHPLESPSFNMLIKGVFDARDIHEATEMLSLAVDCGVSYSEETFSIVLNGLSKKPKYQLILLAQMVVRGFEISSEAYAILIHGVTSSMDRSKEAALLFNLMVDEGRVPKPELLQDLLSIFAGRSALHMISCSIDKLLYTHGVLSSGMYSLLINGFWREGNKRKACELLDVMLEQGWVPDATIHRLFIGPNSIEESNRRVLESDNSVVRDNVSSILTEGLEEYDLKLADAHLSSRRSW